LTKVLRATKVETIKKNTYLKDGLYHIIDNAVEYDPTMTLSDFELFPNSKWEDFEIFWFSKPIKSIQQLGFLVI
jgi:hypothetical protein